MNSSSEFTVGESYLYKGNSILYKCVGFASSGKPIVETPGGAVFVAIDVSYYSLAPKPPVITKTYANLYGDSVQMGHPTLEQARNSASKVNPPVAQIEYIYSDGVLTDVAFIKQIGN